MVIVVMGVSGAGKTTVGQALAQRLQWKFADADDYHSVGNIAKMRGGIPLSDADREPWLEALHAAIADWLAARQDVVLACSALKASYRAQLLIAPEVKLVNLHVDRELVAERLASRKNHYMNPELIESQFATLEEPASGLTLDASLSTEAIVRKIRQALDL
jgi:gluconokinase